MVLGGGGLFRFVEHSGLVVVAEVEDLARCPAGVAVLKDPDGGGLPETRVLVLLVALQADHVVGPKPDRPGTAEVADGDPTAFLVWLPFGGRQMGHERDGAVELLHEAPERTPQPPAG